PPPCSPCGSLGATRTGFPARTHSSWASASRLSRRSETCSSHSSSAKPARRTRGDSSGRMDERWTASTRSCLAPSSAITSGSPMSKLLILGSTGSIGTQALDIVARDEELELVGLSAERSWEALLEQARAHRVPRIALVDEDAAARA